MKNRVCSNPSSSFIRFTRLLKEGVFIFSLSPGKKERLALCLLGILQIWALWSRTCLNPLLFLSHFTWDYTLRFLFFFLVFGGRYYFFPAYRNPQILVAVFLTTLTGQAVLFWVRQTVDEWYLAGLFMIDFIVTAVFLGIILEFTIRIIQELSFKPRPFGYDLSSPGQRFCAAERGLATHLNLAVYFIFLILLGLYALNVYYIFDWSLYCRSGALLILVFFFLPLLRFQARLRKPADTEGREVAERLETLYAFALSQSGDYTKEIGVLMHYHRFLLTSSLLPWRWDRLLILTGSLLILLFQPAFWSFIMPG